MAMALSILFLGLGSCIPSNIIAPKDREVKFTLDSFHWKPAMKKEIPGLYQSLKIEGPPAEAILKIYYYFDGDGSFTAAALMNTHPPSFQIQKGSWNYEHKKLLLGEQAAPANLDAWNDYLRIRAKKGSVILHRETLQ